jgi:hypothetical protein
MYTFRQQFVDVVYKLESKYYVISDQEVHSHAVYPSLFDLELPNFFDIVVFEIEVDVSSWPPLTNQLDLDYLDFCWLIFLEILLFDVPQKGLFVVLQ